MDDHDLYESWLASRRLTPQADDVTGAVMRRIRQAPPEPLDRFLGGLRDLFETSGQRWPAWTMGILAGGLGLARAAGIAATLLTP